jgi:hypothetical protein
MIEVTREFPLPEDVFERQRVLVGAYVGAGRQSARPVRWRVVAIAAVIVVVGAAAAFAVRAYLDKGFIGLPPSGAAPSTPKRGQLVLEILGRGSGFLAARVYADGRVIWRGEGNFPYGANTHGTGWLEQRLTPAGVERLRSEVLSTGLFDRNVQFKWGGWGVIRARRGDRLVRVAWGFNANVEGAEEVATVKQVNGLNRLMALFVIPRRWLPASAWEDPKIRAYVPSRFVVCYGSRESTKIARSRILVALPPLARDLLRGKDLKGSSFATDPSASWYCSAVTTPNARILERAIDRAGNKRVQKPWLLAFTLKVPHPMNSVRIEFEPMFPDGGWLCSACG